MSDKTKYLIARIRATPAYGEETRADLLGLALEAADALEAAGVAPQAPSESAHRGIERDTEMGGVACSECGWHLAGLRSDSDLQSRHHAEAFPQPLSFDMVKIAEVLRKHACEYGDCVCGWQPTIGDGDLTMHQTRAVIAHLIGESK